MSDCDGNDEGMKVLHRMIAYVRSEALRLQIMDVAMLLEHAEDAVIAAAPMALADSQDIDFIHQAPDLTQ